MRPGILLMVRELHHGGSERQLTEIALGLAQSRFQPHVGAYRVEGIRADELRTAGIPVFQIPIQSFKSLAPVTAAWTLARYIRQNNIQLVHTFDMPLTAYAIPTVRLLTSVKALGTQRCHLSLAGPYLRRFVTFANRRAHGVVVNCQFLKRHLVEDEGVPPQRVHVCYNGLDLSRFRRARTTKPSEASDGPLVIGWVGVLRPEKGLSTLLDAFAQVHSKLPGLQLFIVGSGPLLPTVQAQARELGIFDACTFQPSTNDVNEWLQKIDIFVLPSLNEALSNALMEAMACGCCPIASRVGGNVELLEDGVRGLLFEPENTAQLAQKLRQVVLDPQLRSRLSTNAHDFVHERFCREASVQRMSEIYEELLSGNGSAS